MRQIDFKGTFNTVAGACYPLTVLDDHSRFNLAPSTLRFPRTLPPITYGSDDTVVQLTEHGVARFDRSRVVLSQALKGLPVAFRPRHDWDGTYDLYSAING